MKCPRCNSQLDFYGLTRTNPKSEERFTTYRCQGCNKVFIPHTQVKGRLNNPHLGGEETTLPVNNERPLGDVGGAGAIPKQYAKALKLFEDFNMKPADKILTADISLPDNDKNPLVFLGKIAGIIYISDKEGKRGQQYIHETEPPYPDFFSTADGKTFLIAGGKMKIQDGWLYY